MGSKGEREALASDYKDDRLQSQFVRWEKVGRECNTLWRPGQLLRKTTIGTLAEFNEDSFFQRNNKVTKAVYKVPGYCNRTALWFDNATGKRIA
jgi:tRNA/tmRNA/rRNA uracil-C5-methylase (TrmA/RlmC/RlmD family)